MKFWMLTLRQGVLETTVVVDKLTGWEIINKDVDYSTPLWIVPLCSTLEEDLGFEFHYQAFNSREFWRNPKTVTPPRVQISCITM